MIKILTAFLQIHEFHFYTEQSTITEEVKRTDKAFPSAGSLRNSPCLPLRDVIARPDCEDKWFEHTIITN
jgi:hypothetical protein